MARSKPKQQPLFREKGGVRKGAGRKKRFAKDIQNHVPREKLSGKHPLHINFKLRDGLQCLRQREVFQAFRAAVKKAQDAGYRVNHFSILRNHGHLIVEVEDNKQLEKLMKIIAIRLALAIKRLISWSGQVFRDRYFLHVLKTPTEVKNALRYVLLNEPRHVHGNLGKVDGIFLSTFMSGHAFEYWEQLLSRKFFVNDKYLRDSVAVSPPRTWLLQKGWLRTG